MNDLRHARLALGALALGAFGGLPFDRGAPPSTPPKDPTAFEGKGRARLGSKASKKRRGPTTAGGGADHAKRARNKRRRQAIKRARQLAS